MNSQYNFQLCEKRRTIGYLSNSGLLVTILCATTTVHFLYAVGQHSIAYCFVSAPLVQKSWLWAPTCWGLFRIKRTVWHCLQSVEWANTWPIVAMRLCYAPLIHWRHMALFVARHHHDCLIDYLTDWLTEWLTPILHHSMSSSFTRLRRPRYVYNYNTSQINYTTTSSTTSDDDDDNNNNNNNNKRLKEL